ncbi:MAG: hypothetical protein GY928_33635 [Colwellia sp.]|nr:hypothetical protein [Colwellia sp.]
MKRVHIWSYGGGRQSTAILILIAQGKLPKPELAIIADTGRERSSTWQYLEKYTKPIMDKLGIPLVIASHELAKVDLYAHNGDLLLPVFTKTGKLPTFCSSEWKKHVVRRKLRQLGYGPKKPIKMWMGMSLDEVSRLRVSDVKWIENYYPLCFTCKLRSHECITIVERFGLPQPPHSSCWMCPNIGNKEWLDIKTKTPDDFEKAVKLDCQTRKNDKKGGVFLHPDLKPLDQVDFKAKGDERIQRECSGFCFT